MATHIQTPTAVQASGTTSSKAFTSNVTASSAIIVCITGFGMSISSVADDINAGNYTELGAGWAGGGVVCRIFAKFNSNAGGSPTAGTVTVTLTGATDFSYTISEFSGMPTSATGVSDADDGATGSSAATDGVTVTFSPTRGNANDTLIGVWSYDSGTTTMATGTGFTQLAQAADAVACPILSEYKSETTTTKNTVTATMGSTGAWDIYGVAIKDAGGGGGTTLTPAQGPMTFTGQAPIMARAILMPDEP